MRMTIKSTLKIEAYWIDLDNLPFPVSTNQEELINQVYKFSNSDYLEKVERFKKYIMFLKLVMQVKI